MPGKQQRPCNAIYRQHHRLIQNLGEKMIAAEGSDVASQVENVFSNAHPELTSAALMAQ